MQNSLLQFSLLLVELIAFQFFAPFASAAGVKGSAHDFINATWNTEKELCRPCHVPHDHARTTENIGLLWNHDLSSATYQLYGELDPQFLEKTPEQPRSASKMCLGCHDGTVAIDSYDGRTGHEIISDTALIGTDLRKTHPISIIFSHEPGLVCDNCHNLHGGGGGPFMLDSALPFFDSRVECPTCHEPHNNIPLNTTPGDKDMLRKPIRYSVLCFHCHAK